MRSLTRDGQPLVVRDSGGSGPAILMLHGLAGHAGEFETIAAPLRETHRVLLLDQRGGLPGDMSRHAYVDDALFVLRELGIEQTVLCGQSLGGHTAMLIAAAHPALVSRLIMIEAGPAGSGSDLPQMIGRWIDSFPVPFTSRAQAAEFFTADLDSPASGAAWAAGLIEREDGLWPRFNRDAMVQSVTGGRPHWTEWESISCPILVLPGANGTMADGEAGRMSAKATVITIPDAAHDAHLDNPAAVLAAIRTFLL